MTNTPPSAMRFYEQPDLIERLSYSALVRKKPIVFLVGAPLTAPHRSGDKGVMSVSDIVNLIRTEFFSEPDTLLRLDRELATSSQYSYQKAFEFLLGSRGPDCSNEIIREAVIHARRDATGTNDRKEIAAQTDAALSQLEADTAGWQLTPGVAALGELLAANPNSFGGQILTSNFDPLIEVAIAQAHGASFRTVLHRDGNLGQTVGVGCHVVHLHGFWYGSDTLHTPRQLTQPRPQLVASLRKILHGSVIVAVAYSGWDDVFTRCLMEVVADDAAFPEVIWTFYGSSEKDIPVQSARLFEILQPGIDRARVTLFKGIDCNSFFPALRDKLARPHEVSGGQLNKSGSDGENLTSSAGLTEAEKTLAGAFDSTNRGQVEQSEALPRTDDWCGRKRELQILATTSAQVISISGMGGQGKSSLASYFAQRSKSLGRDFDFWDWRDCREQGNRVHTALVAIIERLTQGRINSSDLADATTEIVTDKFFDVLADQRILFVFDNIDHYVDLQTGEPLGAIRLVAELALARTHKSTFVFTSRPPIAMESGGFIGLALEGLNKSETQELFETKTGTRLCVADLDRLYLQTDGHPLWISLVAAQSSRHANGLNGVIDDINKGRGTLPEKTLRSIWSTLNEKQKKVLRMMAELEKPEDERSFEELIPDFNFNQLTKALKALKALHLVLIRSQQIGPEVLDLHPLIRQFIRTEFPKKDRESFISRIVSLLDRRIALFRRELGALLPTSVLECWIHKVDLDLNRGFFESAVETLAEIAEQLHNQGFGEHCVRLGKRLLYEIDWAQAASTFQKFDSLVNRLNKDFVEFDEVEEADRLLEKYLSVIPGKGAQYINYCGMMCYRMWFTGAYEEAIYWGEKGDELKRTSQVDTPFDCAHDLALARRDAGRFAEAIDYFLAGESIQKVADISVIDKDRNGVFYGNVGRCLYLQGEISKALSCYKKSAQQLEEQASSSTINKGYVRYWVALALRDIDRVDDACIFFRAAIAIWKGVAPRLASDVVSEMEEVMSTNPGLKHIIDYPVWKLENRFVEWINRQEN